MKTYTIPPLFDHHSHYSLYNVLTSMPSLAGVHEHEHACEIINGSTGTALTVIQGWNSSFYDITHKDLGDHKPVIVLNLSLHGMIMNHPAEEYLSRDYKDIVLNHGNPQWVEKNLPGILNMIVRLNPVSAENIRSFGVSIRDAGIAAMEDMLPPGSEWFSIVINSPVHVEFWADEHVYASLTSSEKGKVKGVKMFADGALGTKTAALHTPYIPGERGIMLMDSNTIFEKFYNFMQQGIPLAVHAIGDMAIEQVVKTVSKLRLEKGCGGPVRMEHAQFINRDTAFAARNAGIILSMQPNFSFDSVIYKDRLPARYAVYNNPFRMLIDEAGYVPGVDLLFGSDGMPHGMQPALQSALFPPYAGQILTLPEFVSGYCMTDADHEWRVQIENSHVEVSRL